jgi:hypothetical protein
MRWAGAPGIEGALLGIAMRFQKGTFLADPGSDSVGAGIGTRLPARSVGVELVSAEEMASLEVGSVDEAAIGSSTLRIGSTSRTVGSSGAASCVASARSRLGTLRA